MDKLNKNSNVVLKQIQKVKKLIQKNFVYVNNIEDAPDKLGGSAIDKIDKDPRLVFHFLEFLFDKEYIDLYKQRGIIFVDDKVTWEFLLKTDCGFIRIYDWKGYSVSIGSVSLDVSDEVKKKVLLIKKLIEENVDQFLEFRKIYSKSILDKQPLDNFMNAWISMEMLLQVSLERGKKENSGLLECLILLVSLIDTMLRYSILLTRINERKTKKVDPDFLELFFQKDDKYLSERKIFNLAEEEVDFGEHNKVEFFKKVNELYDWRNRAVHRYAITNFQYIEIKDIIYEYRNLKEILAEIIIKLERQQVDLGVGFLREDELLPLSKEAMEKMVNRVFEIKIDPTKILKKNPERDVMFSDKYKGGVNPKIKKIVKQFEKELTEKFAFEQVGHNKYKIKSKK